MSEQKGFLSRAAHTMSDRGWTVGLIHLTRPALSRDTPSACVLVAMLLLGV